jgi:type I site-specific restriction endonuclease
MIEFKQIVGRGTRMFDGKIFTIYDFVDAYHFADRNGMVKQNLMYAESGL